MRQRRPRQIDADHLAFIRTLPCVVCRNDTMVEAAHIRAGDPRAAKRAVGLGEKPDDIWVLPLCRRHHDEQHRGSERTFWFIHGIDPTRTAAFLALKTGDTEAAIQIIENARGDHDHR